MNKNSMLMSGLRKIGLDKYAFSIRRFHVPVNKDALVLEVGSGGNPYYRSNVLIDAYVDTRERHYAKLISDRPTVLGFVENLPFKDNSFDFVIASHVLEHSKDPVKFISEIQRVSKAGYIEVPDAFFERLTCYLDHKLEITDIDNELIIRKKSNYIEDEEVRELFLNKFREIFAKVSSTNPFHFTVRYYWSQETGGIKYKLKNKDYEIDWEAPTTENPYRKISKKEQLKNKLLMLARKYLSQNKRNKSINIYDLIMCVNCHKSDFVKSENKVICKNCKTEYPMINDEIIKFN